MLSNQPLKLPFSQACERNKDIIFETIRPYLVSATSVLEIGSGTAQHSLYFAKNCPHLSWQTSDQSFYLDGIRAQLSNNEIANILPPLELDVNQSTWIVDAARYDIVYTANTLHIMRWSDVQAFFNGLGQVSKSGSVLIIYGPFKYAGEFTSNSNGAFDQSLRAGGQGSAIRDYEAVEQLAIENGFSLIMDVTMPANNQCLIWRLD